MSEYKHATIVIEDADYDDESATNPDEELYGEAMDTIHSLGYKTIPVAVKDNLILGEYDKEAGTWTEINDAETMSADSIIISLAQARYYKLAITSAD